jgi:hypothetical protein
MLNKTCRETFRNRVKMIPHIKKLENVITGNFR